MSESERLLRLLFVAFWTVALLVAIAIIAVGILSDPGVPRSFIPMEK